VETSTGAAIVLYSSEDRNRVLLTKRSQNKTSFPGFWELPGGAIEKDEGSEECIRREIHEELGTEIQDLELLFVDLSYHDAKRHIVFVYQGKFCENTLRINSWEIEDYQIVNPLSPLPENLFPRVDEELKRYATANGLSPSLKSASRHEYFDKKASEWDQQRYRIDRADAVARGIRQAISVSDVQSVLDFGCGTGLLGFEFLNEFTSVTFADTSIGMLEQVGKKLAEGNVANCKLLNLEMDKIDSQYDLIVSLMSLHHIEDYLAQIRTLSSSLLGGGFLCLCDLDKEDGSFHTEEVVPHHGFDRAGIEKAMQENGLEVVSSTTPFVNKKVLNGIEKLFPAFLIVGRNRVD